MQVKKETRWIRGPFMQRLYSCDLYPALAAAGTWGSEHGDLAPANKVLRLSVQMTSRCCNSLSVSFRRLPPVNLRTLRPYSTAWSPEITFRSPYVVATQLRPPYMRPPPH